MTDLYAPDLAGGFRWNDSSFGIEWPVRSDIVISDRDALYRDFDRQAFEAELARRSGATA
jgi:dTDP-4-dehydrorhamnose 3,5-epimerase